IEAQVELILPAELEPGFAKRVIALLCPGMPFCKIGCMRGDLVSNDTVLDVFLIWQSKVLLRRDVTQHCSPVPADHRSTDCTGDVIVTGGDICRKRAERIEGRFV